MAITNKAKAAQEQRDSDVAEASRLRAVLSQPHKIPDSIVNGASHQQVIEFKQYADSISPRQLAPRSGATKVRPSVAKKELDRLRQYHKVLCEGELGWIPSGNR